MRDGELEGSLLSVIGSSGGKDLLKEAAEFTLDAVLDDGVVKNIPVVGTVAKLFRMCVGVQGYVFAKKVRRFLEELTTIPQEDRDHFARQIENDKKEQSRTAEVLVVLLDKLDDIQKTPLLARAFGGYVRSEYDFSTFQRLAAAIDRCLVLDLAVLERLSNPSALEPFVGDVLTGAGLVHVEAIPALRGPGAETTYGITKLGRLFLQVVVKGLPRDD